MPRMIPTNPVPELDLPLAGGGRFLLSESRPETFTMLMFYRGHHCPICKGQLNDLQDRLAELSEAGVLAVAISMDDEERANASRTDRSLSQLNLAYGLSEAKAREFGLYISSAIAEHEPEIFSEPGLFLVKPDGTLYFGSTQTAPFTRPPLDELMMGINYHRSHNYPARGTVA